MAVVTVESTQWAPRLLGRNAHVSLEESMPGLAWKEGFVEQMA
ncbi:MAG: hypothetical protein ACYCZC_02910 [Acidithiobacillus sp.]